MDIFATLFAFMPRVDILYNKNILTPNIVIYRGRKKKQTPGPARVHTIKC